MAVENLSHIPGQPKAVGFSGRLYILLAAVLVVTVVLFLFFLKHYSPQAIYQRKHMTGHEEAKQGEEQSATALIKHIQSHKAPRVVTVRIPPTIVRRHQTYAEAGAAPSLTDNDMKQGGDASISVFHTDASQQSNNAAYSNSNDALPSYGLANGFKIPHMPSGGYKSQNMQSEKLGFLGKNDKYSSDQIKAKLQIAISPYTVSAGSIIPAILVTGINSDLPGQMIARVRRNVFDSQSGQYLLIPQGASLLGTYDSQVAYGQSRILIVWSRIVLPNGSSFDLHGMPGVDLAGMAGLKDQVNNHYMRVFGSALMFSVFGALGQLSQPQSNNNQLSNQQLIYGAIGQQLSQTATQMVAKNMNIQPTLAIRPGANFNVLLSRDMVLSGAYHD
ncbi:MAG: TrbI/VirB10 family protein [Coxiellaceae bacterium]|nr:TrbI/VirB10 family protein [Coxiellaceae bacterium]